MLPTSKRQCCTHGLLSAAVTPTQRRRRRRAIKEWADEAAKEILEMVRPRSISKQQLLRMRVTWKVTGCGATSAPAALGEECSGAAVAPARNPDPASLPDTTYAYKLAKEFVDLRVDMELPIPLLRPRVTRRQQMLCIKDCPFRFNATGKQAACDVSNEVPRAEPRDGQDRAQGGAKLVDGDGDIAGEISGYEDDDSDGKIWRRASLCLLEKLKEEGKKKFSYVELQAFGYDIGTWLSGRGGSGSIGALSGELEVECHRLEKIVAYLSSLGMFKLKDGILCICESSDEENSDASCK